MPLLQEKTTKFDSNERRLGLVAYSIRFMSLASQQRTKPGTMSAAAAAASRASAVGRRAADAQTATATIRVLLRASSTVYVFR